VVSSLGTSTMQWVPFPSSLSPAVVAPTATGADRQRLSDAGIGTFLVCMAKFIAIIAHAGPAQLHFYEDFLWARLYIGIDRATNLVGASKAGLSPYLRCLSGDQPGNSNAAAYGVLFLVVMPPSLWTILWTDRTPYMNCIPPKADPPLPDRSTSSPPLRGAFFSILRCDRGVAPRRADRRGDRLVDLVGLWTALSSVPVDHQLRSHLALARIALGGMNGSSMCCSEFKRNQTKTRAWR